MRATLFACLSATLVLSACQNAPEPQGNANVPPVATPVTVSERPAAPVLDAALIFRQPLAQRADVQRFIAAQPQAQQAQWQRFIAGVQEQPKIITFMDKPGTSRPWYKFAPDNAGNARIAAGRRFVKQNQSVLNAVGAHYGVDPTVIAAILGIETNYGKTMGNWNTGNALATLAFDYPRRAAYFQGELVALMQMAQEERRAPESFKGSYAGAMGMAQFMPSSYLKYAVDWNRDGKRDLWNNVGDAAASIANYLKQHGWQQGRFVMRPIEQPQPSAALEALIDAKTSLDRSAADLRRMGIAVPADIPNSERVILFRLEEAPNQYRYYLGDANFYAIWQYNHSRHYVSAVNKIAQGLR